MSRCRECFRDIKFVKLESTGRHVPVDPGQDPEGDVVARRDLLDNLIGRVVDETEVTPPGSLRFERHFKTCVAEAERRHAREHRRKAEAQPEFTADDF